MPDGTKHKTKSKSKSKRKSKSKSKSKRKSKSKSKTKSKSKANKGFFAQTNGPGQVALITNKKHKYYNKRVVILNESAKQYEVRLLNHTRPLNERFGFSQSGKVTSIRSYQIVFSIKKESVKLIKGKTALMKANAWQGQTMKLLEKYQGKTKKQVEKMIGMTIASCK